MTIYVTLESRDSVSTNEQVSILQQAYCGGLFIRICLIHVENCDALSDTICIPLEVRIFLALPTFAPYKAPTNNRGRLGKSAYPHKPHKYAGSALCQHIN